MALALTPFFANAADTSAATTEATSAAPATTEAAPATSAPAKDEAAAK